MEQKQRETKRCPYCGEEIMATAKKCRYCGSWLTGEVTPTSNPPVDNTQHGDPIDSLELKRASRPNVVVSIIILVVAAFVAVCLTAAMHSGGGRMPYNSGDENDTTLTDSAFYENDIDTMSYDYPSDDLVSDASYSDNAYSESYDETNAYCETYLCCKGKFVHGGTPIELKFSIDEAGGISDGCVVAPLSKQRYDDLSGQLSGNHLDMTFANEESSVSLDIVSNGKMTGTIEGDEVTLSFTIQRS